MRATSGKVSAPKSPPLFCFYFSLLKIETFKELQISALCRRLWCITLYITETCKSQTLLHQILTRMLYMLFSATISDKVLITKNHGLRLYFFCLRVIRYSTLYYFFAVSLEQQCCQDGHNLDRKPVYKLPSCADPFFPVTYLLFVSGGVVIVQYPPKQTTMEIKCWRHQRNEP